MGQNPRAEFRAIYDAWFDDVSRWIRALGGLEADRDDIVQEVFLVVRRRLQGVRRRQHRRLAVPHHHPAGPGLSPPRLGEAHLHAAPLAGAGRACPTPGAARRRRSNTRRSSACCTRCWRRWRRRAGRAFVLFEIEGLSGEEIARIQSIPLNTVWTRLHHARREFFALAAKYQAAQASQAQRRKDSEMERTRR